MKTIKMRRRRPHIPHYDDVLWWQRLLRSRGYDCELSEIHDVYEIVCRDWLRTDWISPSNDWPQQNIDDLATKILVLMEPESERNPCLI